MSRLCLYETRSKVSKNLGVIFGKPTWGMGAKTGAGTTAIFLLSTNFFDTNCLLPTFRSL